MGHTTTYESHTTHHHNTNTSNMEDGGYRVVG